MQNIIEISELKKNFGTVRAVDDITFSVEEGSLFAFLGLNGAGKTTTINIICTILKKDSGKVNVAGFDLDVAPEKKISESFFRKPYLTIHCPYTTICASEQVFTAYTVTNEKTGSTNFRKSCRWTKLLKDRTANFPAGNEGASTSREDLYILREY